MLLGPGRGEELGVAASSSDRHPCLPACIESYFLRETGPPFVAAVSRACLLRPASAGKIAREAVPPHSRTETDAE